MRFSIIVTAHNSERYIRNALNSIASQLFKDYELIVVCNDCQDRTEDVARLYTQNVFTCNHENCTMTHNIGIDKATGEYILFVHDDDWLLHPLALEMIDRNLTDEDMFCFGFIFGSYGFKKPNDNDGMLYPAIWSKAWKREFIGETRLPDTVPAEDLYFSQAIMDKGAKITLWNEPLYFYNYLRPGSYSEVMEHGG